MHPLEQMLVCQDGIYEWDVADLPPDVTYMVSDCYCRDGGAARIVCGLHQVDDMPSLLRVSAP